MEGGAGGGRRKKDSRESKARDVNQCKSFIKEERMRRWM